MKSNPYTQFFAAWQTAKIPLERSEFIRMQTGGAKSSLTELTPRELANIVAILNSKKKIDPQLDRMRKKVIALYRNKYPGAPASDAIRWAQNQGARTQSGTMVHRKFNNYSKYELSKLIDAAESMAIEEYKRISNL